MITTATALKTTTPPDGWSRELDANGVWRIDNVTAFQIFMAVKYHDVPAYAINVIFEDGMGFQGFLEKNDAAEPVEYQEAV